MSGGGGCVSPPLTTMEGHPPTTTANNVFSQSPPNGPSSPEYVSPGSSGANFTLGSPSSSSSNNSYTPSSSSSYPPNHPLSGSKHLCAICEDRASGKHYGVFSCEGCKGFFKRTVRKELQYACRENKSCIIDKRHRNRCQFCRYNKCLVTGMKREAVQGGGDDGSPTSSVPRKKSSAREEGLRKKRSHKHKEERQRNKGGGASSTGGGEKDAVGPSGILLEMSAASIQQAEMMADIEEDTKPELKTGAIIVPPGVMSNCDDESSPELLGFAARRQLDNLVKWAKLIPHFRDLPINDQMLLLKNGWNELIIASFSYRSMNVTDAILLSEGVKVTRNNAHPMGVGLIFDRVLTELVAKMKEMHVDSIEIGCLRSIVLYNPDVKGLSCPPHIECLRERVYSTLEEHTKTRVPDHLLDNGRFPKLLLRLPALRSIGLRCLEHLFYYKMFCEDSTPIDSYLTIKLNENLSESP